MRDIKEGDTITAYWTLDRTQLTGIVENRPANSGDLWYLRLKDRTLVAINPMCADFEQFIKSPQKQESKP